MQAGSTGQITKTKASHRGLDNNESCRSLKNGRVKFFDRRLDKVATVIDRNTFSF